MRGDGEIRLLTTLTRWAIADVVIVAVALGGLWCVIVFLTGFRRRARRRGW
jgi:hypothetical protein